MQVGDLVVRSYSWPTFETGIVVEIKQWVDKGAPDRNFGIDYIVLWENGNQTPEADFELMLLSEFREREES